MTKIKNTKKGMAKKTLSISLAVAMLATSNVPVWAAEFTDGTDAAFTSEAVVETPVEDVVTDAPVVEEEVAPEGREVDHAEDVNRKNYTVTDLKMGTVGKWHDGNFTGDTVTVSGSIKDNGTDVTGLKYTWYADGVEAAGTDTTGTTSTNTVDKITYLPVKADFNKTLSLRVYKEMEDGTVIFSQTITGGKVQPQKIESTTAVKFENMENDFVYDGEEKKLTPSNADVFKWTNIGDSGVNIESDQITWTYTTEGNDFTNVTEKDINVVGVLEGTYDRKSSAFGFVFTSETGKYQVEPLEITSDNLKPSLKTESVEYTNAKHTFGKSEVKVEVVVNEETQKRVDITDMLKDDFSVTGNGIEVGTGYKASAKVIDWTVNAKADTDAADKIFKNFRIATTGASKDVTVATTNTYKIVKRNLNNCTGVVTTEYNLDDFKGKSTDEIKNLISLADIKLTGKDGKSFTADQLKDGDVVLQVNKVLTDYVAANKKGEVPGAITLSYGVDKNVEGSITLPIRLTTSSINEIWVDFATDSVGGQKLNTTKTGAYEVPYVAKAYSLETELIKAIEVTSKDKANGQTIKLKPSQYTVSFDDNVNAGYVAMTVEGTKGESYEGSSKTVYFKISPDKVKTTDFTVKETVTVNPANNHDVALYKDALGMKFETVLEGDIATTKRKATLEYDKDYTVDYYYVKAPVTGIESINTVAKIKANAGTNVPGDYVFAVATPVKNGNFAKENSNDVIFDYAKIEEKSISNVTITLDKDSYTFTGKEIVPKVTVTDGSITLDEGIDYVVKVKNGTDVGTATVMVIALEGSDYDAGTYAEKTFEITPAKAEDVNVTLKENDSKAEAVAGKINTFKYSGRQIKPLVDKVELNGVDVTKYFDITYVTYGENVNAGKEMGSVTIAPKTTTKNFTGSKKQLFDIKGKELKGELAIYNTDKTKITTDEKVAIQEGVTGSPYSFRYDGDAHTFGDERFTADKLFDVEEGKDYEIKYINNVDAGTGFVAVVAKGNYEANTVNADFTQSAGTQNARYLLRDKGYSLKDGVLYRNSKAVLSNVVDLAAFNIEPAYFTARNIDVKNGTYAAGKPVKPEVTVTVNGKTLVEGTDYYLELSDIDHPQATPDQFVDVTSDKPYYVTVHAKGGYEFDNVSGTNTFIWGIDKKDLADCFVSVTKDGDELDLVVMNGNVVEKKESFDVKDNGDGTATVSVIDGGKSYTGSQTVTIVDPDDTGAVGQAMIKDVKVVGNKATVVLEGNVDSALGYDYVISTTPDYKSDRVTVVKNQLKSVADFTYVQQGTYYAYCHAWKRDAEGKKVFGEWSNLFKFEVESITPSQPVIKKVTRKGNDVTVTYSTSEDATGYDVVLGREMATVTGEKRPVKYDGLVKKNQKTTTVTFKNVPDGTYYVGLHAFNRTAEDGKKVFSPWSQAKKITVK